MHSKHFENVHNICHQHYIRAYKSATAHMRGVCIAESGTDWILAILTASIIFKLHFIKIK